MLMKYVQKYNSWLALQVRTCCAHNQVACTWAQNYLLYRLVLKLLRHGNILQNPYPVKYLLRTNNNYCKLWLSISYVYCPPSWPCCHPHAQAHPMKRVKCPTYTVKGQGCALARAHSSSPTLASVVLPPLALPPAPLSSTAPVRPARTSCLCVCQRVCGGWVGVFLFVCLLLMPACVLPGWLGLVCMFVFLFACLVYLGFGVMG